MVSNLSAASKVVLKKGVSYFHVLPVKYSDVPLRESSSLADLHSLGVAGEETDEDKVLPLNVQFAGVFRNPQRPILDFIPRDVPIVTVVKLEGDVEVVDTSDREREAESAREGPEAKKKKKMEPEGEQEQEQEQEEEEEFQNVLSPVLSPTLAEIDVEIQIQQQRQKQKEADEKWKLEQQQKKKEAAAVAAADSEEVDPDATTDDEDEVQVIPSSQTSG